MASRAANNIRTSIGAGLAVIILLMCATLPPTPASSQDLLPSGVRFDNLKLELFEAARKDRHKEVLVITAKMRKIGQELPEETPYRENNTCISLILIFSLISFPALADDPSTLAETVTHVRDGDTIEVGEVPIRLNGVSAPELDEQLGKRSKLFMRELVLGQLVRCELNGEKSYVRFVGTCYLNGNDIGALVIEAGLALDCPRYSGGRYGDFEQPGARERIKLPKYCE